MAFVPVPNTCEVEFRMMADLQRVENTLWFEFLTSPETGDMLALAEILETWWGSVLAELLWGGVVLKEIVVTDHSAADGIQVTRPAAPGFNGQLTTDPLPTSVSLAVSFRSDKRGRSFRGRNYLVGLVEEQTIGANQFSSGLIADAAAAYTQLIGIGVPANAVWVIASRFHGVTSAGKPIPRTTGIATPVVSVVVVDDIVDSQRRRLPGRGK